MAILDFLSVLKKLTVRRYYQDAEPQDAQDYTEGVLCLYGDKYTYAPRALHLADRDGAKPEWAAHLMKPSEASFDAIVAYEFRAGNGKKALLVLNRREGGAEYYAGQADQLQSFAAMIRARLKTDRPVADAPVPAPPAAPPAAAGPGVRPTAATGGLRLPIFGAGAQEKCCKFCETTYPSKALYCPNCGAFETRKGAPPKPKPQGN